MVIKRATGLLIAGVLLGLVARPSFAQMGPGGQPIDPAMVQQMISQYQQRMMDNLKLSLGSTDDEFKVLQPKIERLIQLRTSEAISGAMGAMRGNRNGAAFMAAINANQSPSAAQKAAESLQGVIDNPDSAPELIAARLADLRAARESAHEEIVQAQNDLKDLLTQKQEAILVLQGLLD